MLAYRAQDRLFLAETRHSQDGGTSVGERLNSLLPCRTHAGTCTLIFHESRSQSPHREDKKASAEAVDIGFDIPSAGPHELLGDRLRS